MVRRSKVCRAGHSQLDLLVADPAGSAPECSKVELSAQTRATVLGMNVHASNIGSVSLLSAAFSLDAYEPNEFFFNECAEEDSLFRFGDKSDPISERPGLFVLVGKPERSWTLLECIQTERSLRIPVFGSEATNLHPVQPNV